MTQNDYYNSKEFENLYHYQGKLGSFCGFWGSAFYVWAPTADAVALQLYSSGQGGEAFRRIIMTRGERGVWNYQCKENLDGTYYTYMVTVEGVSRETADPYAIACGANGMRSMVLDLNRTNPEGWQEDTAPVQKQENIIYEVHVKEFSWDEASGIEADRRGRYLGLCQPGTTLRNEGVHPTGMDYLKELGVTHIQLMPVFDYGSVDEEKSEPQFNWGYDPVNYNIPEGSYSSDPYHGEVRIRELKEAIQTLHKNGFRVIMDVVYNHTYSLDSWLNRTVPGYYYRFKEDGSPSNGSGCGNDTASERSMCGKYILDSVLYWAEEYHFDGFRFDLMGLLPVNLMNQIRSALDERFGKNEKMVFGEPWRAGATVTSPGTILADKEHLCLLSSGVGAFCDSTRDAVKGNLMNEAARGMVNGGTFSVELLNNCIRGWAGIEGEYSVNAPRQNIGYLSCHDDWTLWDRLINTMDEQKSYTGKSEQVMRANRLAAAIMTGCQGNLFLLSGEEFARTKQGIKNSYISPIQINQMDWERAWENKDLSRYYQGLFALRKQLPGLCDKAENASRWIREIYEEGEECAVVKVNNPAEQSPWESVLFCYNMAKKSQTIELPEGSWQLLADGDNSYCWMKDYYKETQIELKPMSAMILGR